MASTQRSEPQEDRSENGSPAQLDFGDSIDPLTFEQILEMDDDEDDREFSRSIVYGFFDQAQNTFKQMESSLAKNDLGQLSSLGHFLKGSSATLGLTKVQHSCEKIQHYGGKKDETGTKDEDDDAKCLSRVRDILPKVRVEYADVEKRLKKFYHDSSA